MIIQEIFDGNKSRFDITFHYGGTSNQDNSSESPEKHRKVDVSIYEIIYLTDEMLPLPKETAERKH
jgi:hypothetical protein